MSVCGHHEKPRVNGIDMAGSVCESVFMHIHIALHQLTNTSRSFTPCSCYYRYKCMFGTL